MTPRVLLLTLVAVVALLLPVESSAQQSCLQGPTSVDFGRLDPTRQTSRAIDITNRSNNQVMISELRLTNGQNGFFMEPRVLPIILPPGGFTTVTVEANGTDTSKSYRDTLFARAECGTVNIPLAFSTTNTRPGPQITGHDFGQQVVSAGACARDAASAHTSRIAAFNTGDADFTVQTIRIEGPDAAAFTFGTTEQIRPGDVVRAINGTDTPRVYQAILFDPSEERSYTADVVLTTNTAQTVRTTLRGVGTTGHVALTEPAPVTTFVNDPKEIIDVPVTFSGARPTTITAVTITGADESFTLESPMSEIVKTFQPNQTATIRVGFRRTTAGTSNAVLSLAGNFSRCDDSTVALSGTATVNTAAPDEALSFSLSDPMPNPASTFASFALSLVKPSFVRIDIVDVRGTVVRTVTSESYGAGDHRVTASIDGLASGTYALRAQVSGRSLVRSIIVAR